MKQWIKKLHLANNLAIAIDAIIAHKSRSLLTALGIVFGVAAVISMMAVGRGAKEEVLKQIELIGVNNIQITPIVEQTEESTGEDKDEKTKAKRFSKGLDLNDLTALLTVLPNIKAASPEVEIQSNAIYEGYSRSIRLIGITNSYFPLANIDLASGSYFTEEQLQKGKAVCIIGSDIRAKFFRGQSPIGKHIKIGEDWLQVIGVTKRKILSEQNITNLGIRNYSLDVYTPLQAVLLRYKDRSLMVAAGAQIFRRGNSVMMFTDDEEPGPHNYHQLDKITLQVEDATAIVKTAEVAERALKRLHNNVVDFEITIPIKLLEQQQRTKDIFNLVLSLIASISLLVGGIGIMNIMLASVLERTREIGTRRALGATQIDIVIQFLAEAILISITGGILGIILGVLGAYFIERFSGVLTIVTPLSVLVAFGVSFITGLFFGFRPANRAARQNPIESLRYE
jgi:putative ABC transport system permease protein